MSRKFFPVYRAEIQGRDDSTVIIELPFAITFSITKTNYSEASTAELVIYNLNKETQKNLFKDIFDKQAIRNVSFYAGYADYPAESAPALSLVFSGQIEECYSWLSGVNFETHVKCWSLGYLFQNSFVSFSVDSNQNSERTVAQTNLNLFALKEKGKSIIDDTVGYCTKLSGDILDRGCVQFGRTIDRVLDALPTNTTLFVDNDKVYVTLDGNPTDVTGVRSDVGVAQINVDTGLLTTPRRTERSLVFDMVFEPSLYMGQVVNLVSETAEDFNGTYQICGLKHNGILGDGTSSKCTTTVNLLYVDAMGQLEVIS